MYASRTIEETRRAVEGDCERGLSGTEALRRLEKNGRNELPSGRKRTAWRSFLEQLNDPLIYVLLAAGAVSAFLREISDAVIISVVVVLNAVVGMVQEGKAQKALDALKKMESPRAVVLRDGQKKEIPASQVTVGDVVCLEAGGQVPADLRLFHTAALKVDESALTGESLPVQKNASFLAGGEVPLGDRCNMAYMSTVVTGGRGEGLVTAVGMQTEIGRIASLISENKEELTPLQKKLGELGKVLSLLSVGLCAALFLLTVLQRSNLPENFRANLLANFQGGNLGNSFWRDLWGDFQVNLLGDLPQLLLTSISLAVAAVPEGLPAVVTICLAMSVTRMARAHTIVRKLPSVETLGSVSVVCSDKTGTLTQNKMTVEKCFLDLREIECEGEREGKGKAGIPDRCREFLMGMVLCNDAAEEAGDPTELALLALADQSGVDWKALRLQFPRKAEIPFDSGRKRMSTCHDTPEGGILTFTKGAPEVVLEHCTQIWLYNRAVRMTEATRRQILGETRKMSAGALRTLAIAMGSGVSVTVSGHGEGSVFPGGKTVSLEKEFLSLEGRIRTQTAVVKDEGSNSGFADGKGKVREENLIFLGLVGMKDPPRPEAARAVALFRQAGVDTVMITGDHVDTALAVGKQLHIAEERGQCITGEEMGSLGQEEFLQCLDRVRIFARVSPAQKVEIVRGFQKKGRIVAMTGDGVNDAPSLKAADIGIAMGKTGTDVARGAADMILTDDNFATIEKAIEEGRGVYENIRKSVIFLLSSNLGELMTMFVAVLAGLAAPLQPVHILWINLITDSLPALALGADRNDGTALMQNPPRKAGEGIFARGGFACTCFYGILIAATSLTAFLLPPLAVFRAENPGILREWWTQQAVRESLREILGRGEVLARAQTYAFTVLGLSQLFHAVGMRDVHTSVFRMKHLENRLMLLALSAGLALQLAVTNIPLLVRAFGTVRLALREWGLLLLLSAMPLLAHEIAAFLAAFDKDV